jgi:hypothetical protein
MRLLKKSWFLKNFLPKRIFSNVSSLELWFFYSTQQNFSTVFRYKPIRATFYAILEIQFWIINRRQLINIILPIVLFGCETWSVTLREEHWRCLRTGCWGEYLGPKSDGVTGEWRKLHNEELNNLYCSPNIVRVIKSRRMRWAGHVACIGRGEVYTEFWWGNLRERDH